MLPYTAERGVLHKFAVSCYANKDVDFYKANPEPCDLCPGECKSCPMVQVRCRAARAAIAGAGAPRAPG